MTEQAEPLKGKYMVVSIKKFSKSSVASAARLYKCYRSKPYEFARDYPEGDKEYVESLAGEQCDFNNWLFDYCFADVVEK